MEQASAEGPSMVAADHGNGDITAGAADADVSGLTSHWNSGPVEGRVKHIKMVKRQMFGRGAELPPLRKRVLLTAAQ
ncbi:hypothetical protein OHB36_33975 [Streptomyces sp. NBC_00320]|uniref:hypothetical protein n=1 Tax=Streptomyces sp. NBC_00320 TaxID=2975711 RepID=UPI00224CD0D1|nr:hypothetical protein [Streptomyces sp. NBC_00320]MCX5151702.1 hypothetical protein [Streptomyces sp. NBC_00320]